MRVLITGVNGFVGLAVFTQLVNKNEMQVTGSLRNSTAQTYINSTIVKIGDISAQTNWSEALVDVDVIVHTAARVHVMHDIVEDPLTEFRSVNVEGTLNLARQGVLAGVKRFVFISSVKVNGEGTKNNQSFFPEDVAAPVDPYGISKMEAEQGLFEIAAQNGLEVVIIRPPLVYGSGVKANFSALMQAVKRKWVLPLGSINNKRSLIALDNLVDLIITCINHPQAAGQIFLASDGHDLSTAELVRGIAKATGVSARLIPVPVWVLRSIAKMVGKSDAVNRLCDNLQVDISKSRLLLGWTPPISVDEGLLRAVKGMQQ